MFVVSCSYVIVCATSTAAMSVYRGLDSVSPTRLPLYLLMPLKYVASLVSYIILIIHPSSIERVKPAPPQRNALLAAALCIRVCIRISKLVPHLHGTRTRTRRHGRRRNGRVKGPLLEIRQVLSEQPAQELAAKFPLRG